MQQFGKVSKSQEDYIRKTMEKFSVNNEQNTFGINKLVNAILLSNGHYEEYISGNDLQNSKFSIIVPPKSDYGLSYLRLKFRERGLDIDGLRVSQDVRELKSNGVSKVIIDFKVKKYAKTIDSKDQFDFATQYNHPRSAELNELENRKQVARKNNDVVAYNSAQDMIKKIIMESRAEVSPQQWDSMSLVQRISFVKVKINEAKILQDEDEFNFWNANLKQLEENLKEQSKVQETHYPSYNTPPLPVEQQNIQKQEEKQSEKKDYRFYYDEMMRAVRIYDPKKIMTETEKKQIIGEIFYHEGYMVDSLTSDEDIRQLLTALVNELGNNDMQIRLSKIIMLEMEEKYNQLHPTTDSKEKSKEDGILSSSSDRLDLSGLIGELKGKLTRVQNEYHSMLSDGQIDDDELELLIRMVDKIIVDGDTLKRLATDKNDIRTITVIIAELEEERKRMKKIHGQIDEIGRIMMQ